MDVMLDLETLSTRPDAVIVSIGACKFDSQTGTISPNTFHCHLEMNDQIELGRHIDADTIRWWMKQSDEARRELNGNLSLTEAISDLTQWIGPDSFSIWSNGASFDIPIIEHACATLNIGVPWPYNSSRCYRTIRALTKNSNPVILENPLAHNALEDAIHQVRQLSEFFKVMHV